MRIAIVILAAILCGCQTEEHNTYQTIYTCYSCGVDTEIIEPPVDIPEEKPVEELPVEAPVEPEESPAEEVEPTTPTFFSLGLEIHSQQPLEATVIQDGDVYVNWIDEAEFIQDFIEPEWSLEYLYTTYTEVIITNDVEALCVRFDGEYWGWPMARCNWSQTRHMHSLDEVKAGFYDYEVIETRVWVSGVSGLLVHISP